MRMGPRRKGHEEEDIKLTTTHMTDNTESFRGLATYFLHTCREIYRAREIEIGSVRSCVRQCSRL